MGLSSNCSRYPSDLESRSLAENDATGGGMKGLRAKEKVCHCLPGVREKSRIAWQSLL